MLTTYGFTLGAVDGVGGGFGRKVASEIGIGEPRAFVFFLGGGGGGGKVSGPIWALCLSVNGVKESSS